MLLKTKHGPSGLGSLPRLGPHTWPEMAHIRVMGWGERGSQRRPGRVLD
jgi:hypothetical protein